MSSYIEKYKSALPERQREELDLFLRQKLNTGEITSEAELEMLRERVQISDDGRPVTTFTRVDRGAGMNTTGYNELMDGVLIDLRALFLQSNITSSALGLHEGTNKAWVKNMNAALDEMYRRVSEYKRLAGEGSGFNAVHYEDFTEVHGAMLNSLRVLSSSMILLPTNSISLNGPNDISRVSVVNYPAENHAAGIYMGAPKQNDVERDYNYRRDRRASTSARYKRDGGTGRMLRSGTTYPGYWLSVCLTDGDVESYIDETTYYGYTVLLRMFYEGSVNLNEIIIDPVSRYKTYVRRVRYRKGGYYLSDSDGWTTLTYTNSDGDTANVSGSAYGKLHLRFPPTSVTALEFMFNAVDYDEIRMLFTPNVVRNALLWDEIADDEYAYLAQRRDGGRNELLTSAPEEDAEATSYMDRVVVNLGEVDQLNEMLATVRSSLNIDASELERIGTTDSAVVTDKAAAAALGDYLIEFNKHEYVVGAYSITPQYEDYPASGVYYSHEHGGYDTFENTVRSIMVEADIYTPALTSVEFYVVTDDATEYPIVPRDTATHREHVYAAVVGTALTFDLMFQPAGDVILYRWKDGAKDTVQTVTPAGKSVTFTGCNTLDVYAVEYTINTLYDSHIINLPDVIPSGVWLHTDVVPAGHTVPLPAAPYMGFDQYDWRNNVWDYNYGIAGYYSDETVLDHDVTSPLWTFDYWQPLNLNNVPATSGLVMLESTRDTMIISGWFCSGVYHVSYLGGTGGEQHEYDYMWHIHPSGWIPGMNFSSGWCEFTLSDDCLYLPESGHTNRAEPIELFVDGHKAEDKTAYMLDEQPALEWYDETHNYQFYMLGNTLYTNVNFDEVDDRRVSIKMKYLTSTIKLKIVMRTNTNELCPYTPRVNNYKLIFFGQQSIY